MMKIPRFFSALSALLSLAATLNANEHYLLPEHNSDLLHTLKLKIERAAAITLITGELESPAIAGSIEKAVQKGASLHLITADFKSAAYFAKYRNTLVKVPRSEDMKERFALNVLIIDNSDICFSSVAFSETLLKRRIGEVICTTAEEEIAFGKQIEERFSKRFEAYNR
jgi:hypothetical protein